MQRVDPAVLEAFSESIVSALGAPQEVAATVAESLVSADLRGHGSHGIIRLSMYKEMIKDGAIVPNAEPVCHEQSPVMVSIDGQSTFGQYTGRIATHHAAEYASTHGVGVVGIRDGTHLGRLGEWAELATSKNLIFMGFASAQGGSQTVAPPGSADPKLATNPITFGSPAFGALPFPIVYDGATSQVANGKIRKRALSGETIPHNWTTTPTGDPISEADQFFQSDSDGALLPLGGHETGYKGFGLAIAVELLGGLIGNGLVAGESEVEWFNNAAMFLALDPHRFISKESARHRVAALAQHLRSTKQSPNLSIGASAYGDHALLPGEPEYKIATDRFENGIPLSEEVICSCRRLADQVGVEIPSEFIEKYN